MNKYEKRIAELREAGNLSMRIERALKKHYPTSEEEWEKFFRSYRTFIFLEEKPEDPDFVGWRAYNEADAKVNYFAKLLRGSLEDDREAALDPMTAIAEALDDDHSEDEKLRALISKWAAIRDSYEPQYKAWEHLTGHDRLGG